MAHYSLLAGVKVLTYVTSSCVHYHNYYYYNESMHAYCMNKLTFYSDSIKEHTNIRGIPDFLL